MNIQETLYLSERLLIQREDSCGLPCLAIYIQDTDPLGRPYLRYDTHVRDTDGGYQRTIRALVDEIQRLKP